MPLVCATKDAVAFLEGIMFVQPSASRHTFVSYKILQYKQFLMFTCFWPLCNYNCHCSAPKLY